MTNQQVVVSIVGSIIACEDGLKDTWREVAAWAGQQLNTHYGDGVQVNYFDLFDPECPKLPENAQLPVVYVNGTMVSSGEKVSIPLIREHVESLLS